LTPLAIAASSPTLFAVKAPTSEHNLMEFVQAHKNRQLTYASAGTGTTEHLTAAYVFKEVPGLQSVHIPYRSGGEVVNAVLGGQVDVASLPAASALPMIQQGKLQPLAVASHNRVAMFPNVPTLAESGLIDLDNGSWVALFGPPGMPKQAVDVLDAKLHTALQDAGLRKRLSEMGFDMSQIAQLELNTFMSKEVNKWRQILQVTGITLEQ
jgi:tripartite-type tricarboxylate transporter receptor subunit TctC